MGRAPQADGNALRWAVLVLSVTAGGAHPIRHLLQAGPASAPSGSLVAAAKQEDYSRPVCQFSVLGGGPWGCSGRPSLAVFRQWTATMPLDAINLAVTGPPRPVSPSCRTQISKLGFERATKWRVLAFRWLLMRSMPTAGRSGNPGTVSTFSVAPEDGSGASAGPLLAANITCRGSTLSLIGGPLLQPFAPAFVGVRMTTSSSPPQLLAH